MGELGFCKYQDIIQEIYRRLAMDLTVDGNTPLILTRFLHNKPIFTINQSLNCYLGYLDLNMWADYISPILYPFILSALFLKEKRKIIWILFLSFPFYFIFFNHITIGDKILLYKAIMILFSILGFIKILLKVINRKKHG
jgi:hypothetical protein